MATQADLRIATAEYLNILAAGETLSSEDAATFNRVLVRVQAELEEKEIAHWSLATIPNASVHGMAIMAGADLAPRYKKPALAVTYVNARNMGEKLLRIVNAKPDSGTSQAKEYF